MSKQAYFFAHDSNARNDIKIIKLRRQLGLEGYGAFWCLIEMLRDSENYRLPLNCIDDIAFDINIAREKLETIINAYGLFQIDADNFFSQRLINSMELYQSVKQRLSEGGKRGMATRYAKKKPDNKNNTPFT